VHRRQHGLRIDVVELLEHRAGQLLRRCAEPSQRADRRPAGSRVGVDDGRHQWLDRRFVDRGVSLRNLLAVVIGPNQADGSGGLGDDDGIVVREPISKGGNGRGGLVPEHPDAASRVPANPGIVVLERIDQGVDRGQAAPQFRGDPVDRDDPRPAVGRRRHGLDQGGETVVVCDRHSNRGVDVGFSCGSRGIACRGRVRRVFSSLPAGGRLGRLLARLGTAARTEQGGDEQQGERGRQRRQTIHDVNTPEKGTAESRRGNGRRADSDVRGRRQDDGSHPPHHCRPFRRRRVYSRSRLWAG
jgi:hypothetical protein